MNPQILSLKEAEVQLKKLVTQTQSTHQPILFTAEENAEPLAVLIDVEQYAAATSNEAAVILAARLKQLAALLNILTMQWDVQAIREAFPTAWRWRLEGVWETSKHREKPFRQLIVLLKMAADGLDMTTFCQEHLKLWSDCLQTLQQPSMTTDDLARCDKALIQQGFPVLLNFDDDMVNLYVADS